MSNNNKTPAIRFKGFTDTWEQRKLGEISESFEYGLNAAATEYDGKHKYIRITDIDDSTHLFLQDNLTSPDVDFSTVDDYLLQKGDVLFARTGASVGKTYIYRPSDGDLYFAGFLIRAKIKSDYDADFIFQNTLTDNYDSYIRITSQRSGQPGVNAQEYANFALSVPCLAEQKKIGAYFTNLDNLITLHQRKYDKLIQFKAAMLKKMFPQNGANKPEIRFRGFTDAWEQRKLEEVITVGNGMDYKHLSEGDIPVYGTGGYMLSVDKALSYDKDAIGIGRKGTIDKPYVLKAPFWTVDTLFYCIPKEDYSLDFVYCIFQNVNWKEKDESTGVPSLSKVNINSTDVKVPTLAEQEKIGEYFSKLDSIITLHQRKCDKYKSIKSGLLKKIFP
nr:MAG TPA: hypothetical protein [Caudoviricetes sp.]